MKKQIIYQNNSINYQVEGQGETLVLLHGFMEDLGMWKYQSEKLSKYYQVICIDLPGHGETGIWSDCHGMDFMADIVEQVLLAENIEKCILVGHSMGGYTTLAFAEKFPHRLNGIGMFHSHTMADSDEVKKNRERTIEIVKNEKITFINQFIPSLFAEENQEKYKKEIDYQIEMANAMNPQGITAALAGMKERSMRLDVIAFSEVPVLFILGKKDSRIAIDHALAQASTAPIAQIIVLGNSGHMAWIEEKHKTTSAIKGFCEFCLS